jgi:hypothetical protein
MEVAQNLEPLKVSAANNTRIQAIFTAFETARTQQDADKKQKLLKAVQEAAAIQQALSAPIDNSRIQTAIDTVTDMDEKSLEVLPLVKKIDLLASLRTTGTAECRKAMAKLYKATDLQPEFTAKDDGMRRDVLDKLKESNALKGARRNWDTMLWSSEKGAKKHKLPALENALHIQSDIMGIEKTERPPIVPFAREPVQQGDDKALSCAGGFQADTNTITINTAKLDFADFDRSLDTVVHENTHKYQRTLIKKLEDGALRPGDPEYCQAILFQLNWDSRGYLDCEDGYVEQPIERHAHLAGGEARKLFVEDAKAEAQILLTKMDVLATSQIDEKARTELAKWQKAMKEAMASGISTEITKFTRTYEADFNKLAEQFKPPTEAKTADQDEGLSNEAKQAKALIRELETWGQKLPGHAKTIAGWGNILTSSINKNAQNPTALDKLVKDYRAVLDELLPQAASLIEEMQSWVKNEKFAEWADTIQEYHCNAVLPRSALSLRDQLQLSRRKFEAYREEKESALAS